MKLTKVLSLLIAILTLSPAVACTFRSNDAINSGAGNDSVRNSFASPTTPESITPTKNNQPAKTARTDTQSQNISTKTDTISIEGQKTEITLKRYDKGNAVFTTYFPEKDFIAESLSVGEGTGAQFIYNLGEHQNKDVFVVMVFPAKATTLEQLKQVAQQHGLIQANQWQMVNRTKEVFYSWAKEKIVYQKRSGSQNIVGEVYVGDVNGKAFYIITHYPAEYGDGFVPRANLILKNLQVKG